MRKNQGLGTVTAFALVLAFASPVLAQMATDASNAVLPDARDNFNSGYIYRRTLKDFGAKCDVQYVGNTYSIAANGTTLT